MAPGKEYIAEGKRWIESLAAQAPPPRPQTEFGHHSV